MEVCKYIIKKENTPSGTPIIIFCAIQNEVLVAIFYHYWNEINQWLQTVLLSKVIFTSKQKLCSVLKFEMLTQKYQYTCFIDKIDVKCVNLGALMT